MWNQHVAQADGVSEKLEFYLMIYFAIYPTFPDNAERLGAEHAAGEMNHLQNYLATRGAQLSKTPEFLAFYALPYIQVPQVRFVHTFL